MTDFADFKTQIADWANRQDWSDALVTSFIRDAEMKLNSEMRIDRMIQTEDATISSCCAPIPDDWLEFDTVSIVCPTDSCRLTPQTYKARHEFFLLPEKWARNHYTIVGRQLFLGGPPDTVNGQKVRISYYGEVPVFSDTVPSWVYSHYPSLYRYAALMHADLHAIGEENSAASMKALAEDLINKLNIVHLRARASGSRLHRSRTRSFG